MEIILDHEEVESLLREALAARGTALPETLKMRFRRNQKRDSIRIVFADRPDNRGHKKGQ
jgi:hypothetical protein